MTVIYPSPIFGPVHSRRLGVSLGINLLPEDGKVCSFDCIYCECGFNATIVPNSRCLRAKKSVRPLKPPAGHAAKRTYTGCTDFCR